VDLEAAVADDLGDGRAPRETVEPSGSSRGTRDRHPDRPCPPQSLAHKAVAAEALGQLARPTAEFVQADGRILGSTEGGRFTKKPDTSSEVPALLYFSVAAAVIAISLIVSEVLSESEWGRAYVIYGSIAMFWVAIPSVLAYWFSKDVPFPTLFSTVADLERRLHFVALALLGLLVVLLLHLALYPWPDIFHGNPTPASP
jgi:hypothetical protein